MASNPTVTVSVDARAVHTAAIADKHLWATFVFAAILVVNHRLALELTPTELVILAAVLGVYIGQSQLAAVSRLRALLGAPEVPAPVPPPPARTSTEGTP